MSLKHLYASTTCIAVFSVPLPLHAQTNDVDSFIQIQPIQVCNDAFQNCAPFPELQTFAQTQDIYSQAGIAVARLPTKRINNTASLSVNGISDINAVGNGQSSNKRTLNQWYTNSVANTQKNKVYAGHGYVGGNGSVINTPLINSLDRFDTAAHEVGHNLGLLHHNPVFSAPDPDNVMAKGAIRNAPTDELTQSQINNIRGSQFVRRAPSVSVDLRGSTPFQTNNFFSVAFEEGSSAINLTQLSIDLSPVDAFYDPTNMPPGLDGSDLGFGLLNGISDNDISISGLFDGSQQLTLGFADGVFEVGDSLAFGSDIDLFDAIDAFGATPEELVGADINFQFDIGLSLSSKLDADLVTTSTSVSEITSVLDTPAPFGPQVPPGQLPPTGTPAEFSPISTATVAPIPLPAGVWLMVGGLLSLFGVRGRHAFRKAA